MNLDKLFKLQHNLDERILKEHNLHEESLCSKKILALQVEISELANETRCFKFWSTKKASEKEVILEEYVDCLHFILSIGLEKDFHNIDICIKNLHCDLCEQFMNFFINITDFIICASKGNYLTLFQNFLSLGLTLGFTEEDIENAYYKKNNVNHQRQDEGY